MKHKTASLILAGTCVAGVVHAEHHSGYVATVGPPIPPPLTYVADQWNFYKGECTSYVAYRLNEAGLAFSNQWRISEFGGLPSTSPQPEQTDWDIDKWSDAWEWRYKAEHIGLDVNTTPTPNAVYCNTSGTIGGHVAFVDSIAGGGAANISEYNAGNDHQYSTRTVTADGVNSFFIHFILTSPSMVPIPAGPFQMGDNYNEGNTDERPVHTVYVSGFYMDKFQVSNQQMADVLQWAYDQGLVGATTATVTNKQGDAQRLLYLDDSGCQINFSGGTFTVDSGKGNFPCVKVTWYGAQAYCNYKSDMEGLQRCIDFSDWSCDFSKSGYRLPTEAEWEKAARGGLTGNHYPWPSSGGTSGDHIDGSMANYRNSGDPYDNGTSPVGYYDGNQTPVGVDMANGYGLYDMVGNVYEWCWDWQQSDWYDQPGATKSNTTGPVGPLSYRVLRGGSSGNTAGSLRCANRSGNYPDHANGTLGEAGFRCARGVSPSVFPLADYDYDGVEGTAALDAPAWTSSGGFSFVFGTDHLGARCIISWSRTLQQWFPLLDFDVTTEGTEVSDFPLDDGSFYRAIRLPDGVIPADSFDYPFGDGSSVPEQISPETNDVYPDFRTADPTRTGTPSATDWYNYQDVGSYNPTYGGIHPGEDWNYGGVGDDIGLNVLAIANGQIIAIQPANSSAGLPAFGWMIVVRHWLPNGDSVDSVYVHVAPDEIGGFPNTNGQMGSEGDFTYQEGSAVAKGQTIAVIGDTSSVGSHLHMEVRTSEVDPSNAWPNDTGDGYYGPVPGVGGNRTPSITQPDVADAYSLMQQDGIVDPSDFIDDHR